MESGGRGRPRETCGRKWCADERRRRLRAQSRRAGAGAEPLRSEVRAITKRAAVDAIVDVCLREGLVVEGRQDRFKEVVERYVLGDRLEDVLRQVADLLEGDAKEDRERMGT